MIPKRIYYTWFGGNQMGELEKGCIESWSRMCPDYEIVRIDENTFDVSKYHFSKVSYDNRLWSYVSDVARCDALSNGGGIYLDTDIMLTRPLDELLGYDGVFFQDRMFFATSPMMCSEKRSSMFKQMLNELETKVCGEELTGNILCVLTKMMNSMYDIAPIHKQTYCDGTCILDESYLPWNRNANVNHFGIHCMRQSWVGSKFSTFKDEYMGFDVIQNGIYDKEMTNRISSNKPIGKIELTGSPFTNEVLKMTNYFFNPNVMRVKNGEVMIERYGCEKKISGMVYIDRGTMIEYEDHSN